MTQVAAMSRYVQFGTDVLLESKYVSYIYISTFLCVDSAKTMYLLQHEREQYDCHIGHPKSK